MPFSSHHEEVNEAPVPDVDVLCQVATVCSRHVARLGATSEETAARDKPVQAVYTTNSDDAWTKI
eukprot:3321705-Pyramimonas_sp.AAC.1